MKRVLLVDDERDVIESLRMALGHRYDLRTARNGREALAVIESEPIDVILLDLMMPIMSGEEVIQELAARGLEIPVVVASANKHVEATCKELGVEHCLIKPYRLQKLLDFLEAAINSSKS
jgi:CheY-like chemotaxis protein